MLFPEALACRTQDDALQCLASRDKPPERDQQLACQRDDHRLARAYTAIGSAGLVPLRQCALFLKPQEPPGELDHAAADPGVAGSGKALFPSLGAALVRRARQAGVARHRFAVTQVGLGPAMFARYRDTRGMDHMRLDPTRTQPPRQPAAVAAGFEGQRNPRDLFTSPDCRIAPAKQQAKQPFGTLLQLLARLTLNAGKHTGNQPARLAHLDDGNDCAILVQGDEGPAQVVRLGHQGTPSVGCSDEWCHLLAACPIPSLRWS